MRGGHARPRGAGIGTPHGHRAPFVKGTQHAAAAAVAAARSGEGDRGTIVRVGGAIAGTRRRTHRQGANAVRGSEAARVAVLVADRGDDDHTARGELIDRTLHCPAAGTFDDQRDVKDLRGRRIVGDTSHRQPTRPAHRIDQVGDAPAAVPDHAHGEELRKWGDADDADPVVRRRKDRPRHVRAVPGRVGGFAALGAVSSDRKIRLADPVTFVARIRIAPISVARARRVTDEVISGKDTITELGVRGDPGVEDGDDDPVALTEAPGLEQVDPVTGFRSQGPLFPVERIVRRRGSLCGGGGRWERQQERQQQRECAREGHG